VRSLAFFACLFFAGASLTAQTTQTTTTATMPTGITGLPSSQNTRPGGNSAGIDATVSAEIGAQVGAAVSARISLNRDALVPATGGGSPGRSLGGGAAGQASQLRAASSNRSSLVSNRSALIRQALHKVVTKGHSRGLTAQSSATGRYHSASASVTFPTDELSSLVGGSPMGSVGGSAAAEGQFPDSTQGTGWPSPPEGATSLEFRVGGFEAKPLGGFMEETHLKPSLMNVTRGEVRAEKLAEARRRMQGEQPAEGPGRTLPGWHSLRRPNLTPSLVGRPQFSDVQPVYPASDRQMSYPK
jgi:hypothetical protein